jgi:hypothetical protein
MTLRRRATRIRCSLIAVLAGWAAAIVATLPMQFAKIAANTFGGPTVLLLSLAEGVLIWGLWSSIVAAGGWLFGLVPVVLLVPESWLLRHPRASLTLAAVFGWIVVLVEFEVWHLLLPYQYLPLRSFSLYSILLVVYTTVSGAIYLHLSAPLNPNSGEEPKASDDDPRQPPTHSVNLRG